MSGSIQAKIRPFESTIVAGWSTIIHDFLSSSSKCWCLLLYGDVSDRGGHFLERWSSWLWFWPVIRGVNSLEYSSMSHVSFTAIQNLNITVLLPKKYVSYFHISMPLSRSLPFSTPLYLCHQMTNSAMYWEKLHVIELSPRIVTWMNADIITMLPHRLPAGRKHVASHRTAKCHPACTVSSRPHPKQAILCLMYVFCSVSLSIFIPSIIWLLNSTVPPYYEKPVSFLDCIVVLFAPGASNPPECYGFWSFGTWKDEHISIRTMRVKFNIGVCTLRALFSKPPQHCILTKWATRKMNSVKTVKQSCSQFWQISNG